MDQSLQYLKLLFDDERSSNSFADSLVIEAEYCNVEAEILKQIELTEQMCKSVRERLDNGKG